MSTQKKLGRVARGKGALAAKDTKEHKGYEAWRQPESYRPCFIQQDLFCRNLAFVFLCVLVVKGV